MMRRKLLNSDGCTGLVVDGVWEDGFDKMRDTRGEDTEEDEAFYIWLDGCG